MQAHEVGDHPTEQGASSVTEVPPHSVDTHRAAPLGGAGDIADHSQQGGIDQGGACPEDDRADSPIRETPKGDNHQSHGLDGHAAGNKGFAAIPVGGRTSNQLPNTPYPGVEGAEHPDLGQAQLRGGKQQGGTGPRTVRS